MWRATIAAALAAVLLGGPAAADDFYSCRLPNGRIEMRDTPCPAGAKALEAQPGRVTVVPGARATATTGTDTRPAPGSPVQRAPLPVHPVKSTPFVDPDWKAGFLEQMLLRARFAGVLSSLHNLRNASMMYNAEQGGWPARAEDLGLDGGKMQTDGIADVAFLPDGTILAALKPGFGEGKFVGMMPKEELGGAQLGWKCVANFPASFFGGSFGASCQSRRIDATPPAAASPQE